MKIETFKVVCYESTQVYGKSPCFLTLEEAVRFMWDHPWGDRYYAGDYEIHSFEQLLDAVTNGKFSPIPEDDRKMFVIEHHEIEVELVLVKPSDN